MWRERKLHANDDDTRVRVCLSASSISIVIIIASSHVCWLSFVTTVSHGAYFAFTCSSFIVHHYTTDGRMLLPSRCTYFHLHCLISSLIVEWNNSTYFVFACVPSHLLLCIIIITFLFSFTPIETTCQVMCKFTRSFFSVFSVLQFLRYIQLLLYY